MGVASKILILLSLVFLGASYTYSQGINQNMVVVFGSLIVAFIFALITIKNPEKAMFTAPIYSVLEGVALGAISVLTDLKYPGLSIKAVLVSGGILGFMSFVFSTKIIKVDNKFMSILSSIMFGIMILYFADLILAMFGIHMPVINDSSPLGIAFSVGVVIVASMCLLADFQQINDAIESNSPKSMEWFSAFGLIVTLVWLYLEVLRLLRKLKDD
jgi:uncharacterized YccA/Bax inhibitor family protein